MLIVKLLVNEKLLNAESALNQADSGNIIELCRNYLAVLKEYRDELSKLRGAPEISFQKSSPLAREMTDQVRKAIRAAIEITTSERNLTESLLESFTSISGYEAADTFNYLRYKGFDNWEMQSGGVRPKETGEDAIIGIQEAVETASRLRREAYITQKVVFLK
jgi:5'-3' exonuclease